jgi:hypothetical protein
MAGSQEPVFDVLPRRIIDDLTKPQSESSLLWNTIYPRAQPTLALAEILDQRPLWGTAAELDDDALIPYYWGFDQAGKRLQGLDSALDMIDGAEQQTEVDLFLLGAQQLVLVEAKRSGGLGRCARYMSERCPEVHIDGACRYWELDRARFASALEFGARPVPEADPPPCNRHYQLARTLLVGLALSKKIDRRLHLWLILPRARWRALEADWLDFVGRIRDAGLWRRLRVYAWENIRQLRT